MKVKKTKSKKAKNRKTAQNEKLKLHPRTISQEQYSIWSWFLIQLCKMMISPGFFHFFKILIFQVINGGKREKMTQDDKKFCLLCSISLEPYTIWLSFMLHLCKMMIPPGVLFIFFEILIFWVVRRVKGQKMVQNDKTFCLSWSMSQKAYIIWY